MIHVRKPNPLPTLTATGILIASKKLHLQVFIISLVC